MILFIGGIVAFYFAIGIVVWVVCRADVVLEIRTEVALKGKDVSRAHLELVVLFLCLGWPYLFFRAAKDVNP